MGMCLGLVALSDKNIARVLQDPPLVWRVIAPDNPEEDDTLEYLMEYFQILRGFLSQTVDEGLGIVVYIS